MSQPRWSIEVYDDDVHRRCVFITGIGSLVVRGEANTYIPNNVRGIYRGPNNIFQLCREIYLPKRLLKEDSSLNLHVEHNYTCNHVELSEAYSVSRHIYVTYFGS